MKALHFHWKMPQLHIEDKSWHFSHLPHHHLLQGDPRSRIFLVRAQQVRSARAFSAAPAPLSPCPAPAGCSCSCGTENQRLSPAESGENPPSLPKKLLGFPWRAHGAGTALLFQLCREGVGRGRTERRGSGGVITSPTTPADLLEFTCQPLSQTGGQRDPSLWLPPAKPRPAVPVREQHRDPTPRLILELSVC